jgi:hypothetical protein
VDDRARKQDAAEVGQGVLVVAGGDRAPLLESVEASLDRVALRVEGGVEAGWPSACGSCGVAAFDLIFASGIVCLIRRERNGVRLLGWEYALSASSRKSRPGTPASRQASACSSSSGISCGLSPASPAVNLIATGHSVVSVKAWIFVVNPPRDRPIAWSAGSSAAFL